MKTSQQIEEWLVGHLAGELEIDPERIDATAPLTRFGLDSLAAVGLLGELETWLDRELPDDLLTCYPTIRSLGEYLADASDETQPASDGPTVTTRRPAELGWTTNQLRTQRILSRLLRLVYRFEFSGLENIPADGPFILVGNHLHIFDTPIVLSFMQRPVVLLVSDHMRGVPGVNWFLKHMAGVIYVTRGEGDRPALAQAAVVLQSGGCVALAPEGKISKTGGLLAGHSGVAHLATMSGAPIIPVVLYGQERLGRGRTVVRVKVGSGIRFPQGRSTARQLDAYLDEVMLGLARMLPAQYRGVYADRVDMEKSPRG